MKAVNDYSGCCSKFIEGAAIQTVKLSVVELSIAIKCGQPAASFGCTTVQYADSPPAATNNDLTKRPKERKSCS